jgi:hypothetical protein
VNLDGVCPGLWDSRWLGSAGQVCYNEGESMRTVDTALPTTRGTPGTQTSRAQGFLSATATCISTLTSMLQPTIATGRQLACERTLGGRDRGATGGNCLDRMEYRQRFSDLVPNWEWANQ